MYFKIDKTKKDEDNIKKCFNNTWYDKCQDKVLLLKEANKNDTGVLMVTGSDNNWKITDQGNVLENADCNPYNNKWIIVKVTTRKVNTECAGDSFIFYVDDINSVKDENSDPYGVFEEIKCYSIEIIAANTSAAQDIACMFYKVESALEKDMGTDTGPGLIGLDKLNVENVKNINWMFFKTIHKQATLDQLKGWRFSGDNKVSISCLFNATVKGLAFSILNGWSSSTKNGTVFFRANNLLGGSVFVDGVDEKVFNPPNWFDYIEEIK